MKEKKQKIRFYKRRHVYKLGKKELTSVTKFVGTLFEPFNAREIARKLSKFPVNRAKKHGVRYFLKEWKEAAAHGTRVHNAIESFIKGENILDLQEKDEQKFYKAKEYITESFKKFKFPDIITEKIVHSEELGLAGTIDLVIMKDGKVTLVDWKTNKAIKREAYKNKKGIHELTKDIDDCNFNKYQLQLSIYAYILEKEYNMPINKLYIVHLKDYYAEEIEVEYQKDLVKELLEDKNGKRNE